MTRQFDLFGIEQPLEKEAVVNVASVPQRSPFRYPGGKTWLVPVFRRWIRQFDPKQTTFVEPFAGGGIVSLTVAFEKLAKQVVMVELDEEVAAVWETILGEGNDWLTEQILGFDMTRENVLNQLNLTQKSIQEIAFSTILKNRVYHGGILAKGSGMIKNGENGKGLTSRWYPTTLKERIAALKLVRHKIEFIRGDAFEVIPKFAGDSNTVFFIDPPYTVAGKRLYAYSELDHEALFDLVKQIRGAVLMTYDDTEEVRCWARKFGFPFQRIPMKTTHHLEKHELLISNEVLNI